MSWRLWNVERDFPHAPVFEWSGFAFIGNAFFFGFLCCLICSSFFGRKLIYQLLLFFVLPVLLADQLRWQPWVYFYLLMLFPFTIWDETHEGIILRLQRIVVIGAYFWSGIHKLNPHFLDGTYAQVAQRLSSTSFPKEVGYLIPLTEIFLAFGLMFLRTRRASVFLLMLMHLVIIIHVISQENLVVVPWNIALIFLLCILFYRSPPLASGEGQTTKASNLVVTGYIILVWIAPVFNFWDKWDN